MAPSTDPKATPPAVPPPLPPSVEAAYRIKCIQMKRRLNEVEASNDAARLRIARQKRQNEKMRLERALLLEILSNRMHKIDGSGDGDESEGSSDGPPTPQEKPLRSKKPHRRQPVSPSAGATQVSTSSVTVQFDAISGGQLPVTNGTATRPKGAATSDHLSVGDFAAPAQLAPRSSTAHPKSPLAAFEEHLATRDLLPDNELDEYELALEEQKHGTRGLTDGRKRENRRSRAERLDVDEDVIMASADESKGADGGDGASASVN